MGQGRQVDQERKGVWGNRGDRRVKGDRRIGGARDQGSRFLGFIRLSEEIVSWRWPTWLARDRYSQRLHIRMRQLFI